VKKWQMRIHAAAARGWLPGDITYISLAGFEIERR